MTLHAFVDGFADRFVNALDGGADSRGNGSSYGQLKVLVDGMAAALAAACGRLRRLCRPPSVHRHFGARLALPSARFCPCRYPHPLQQSQKRPMRPGQKPIQRQKQCNNGKK